MGMLIVKRVEVKDFYKTYVYWCEGHKFPAMHPNNLDQCFVCYNGIVPIYSCFLWNTPSQMALLGFPISNPDAKQDKKDGGLNFLFKTMGEIVKKEGYGLLWTTSSTERVIDSLTDEGFVVADENVNQYVKTLF